MPQSTEVPWVVFNLGSEVYALSIDTIEEIVRVDGVAPLPGVPAYVRGLMTLRGRALPVLDLRTRLGMPSLDAEREALITMLQVREQEHRDWLSELEHSVVEKRPFGLAIDPHQCAFGRWYDTFETQNQTLDSVLRRFDAPHKAIHGIAQAVTDLVSRQAFDDALALIERTRNGELALMIQIFASTRQIIRELRREVVLIVRQFGRSYALAVDAVESIEPLALNEDTNGVLDADEEHAVASIAQGSREHGVVMVLNPDALLSGLSSIQGDQPLA